jgi:hypothetical protein
MICFGVDAGEEGKQKVSKVSILDNGKRTWIRSGGDEGITALESEAIFPTKTI